MRYKQLIEAKQKEPTYILTDKDVRKFLKTHKYNYNVSMIDTADNVATFEEGPEYLVNLKVPHVLPKKIIVDIITAYLRSASDDKNIWSGGPRNKPTITHREYDSIVGRVTTLMIYTKHKEWFKKLADSFLNMPTPTHADYQRFSSVVDPDDPGEYMRYTTFKDYVDYVMDYANKYDYYTNPVIDAEELDEDFSNIIYGFEEKNEKIHNEFGEYLMEYFPTSEVGKSLISKTRRLGKPTTGKILTKNKKYNNGRIFIDKYNNKSVTPFSVVLPKAKLQAMYNELVTKFDFSDIKNYDHNQTHNSISISKAANSKLQDILKDGFYIETLVSIARKGVEKSITKENGFKEVLTQAITEYIQNNFIKSIISHVRDYSGQTMTDKKRLSNRAGHTKAKVEIEKVRKKLDQLEAKKQEHVKHAVFHNHPLDDD